MVHKGVPIAPSDLLACLGEVANTGEFIGIFEG